jgi:ubiquinone/menaquinone biosynthesis C-methylase UbiE
MRRIRNRFLDSLEGVVPLAGCKVLEVGCGSGEQTAAIAKRCQCVTGVDPDSKRIEVAEKLRIPNAKFYHAQLPGLNIASGMYDVAIFTLSLHHILRSHMTMAIDEVAMLVKRSGRIVFLEPGLRGSYFEAEIRFNAGDGDETNVKMAAAHVQLNHRKLAFVCQIPDKTAFRVDSLEDFNQAMKPKKNESEIPAFLKRNHNVLIADRWINVFRLRTEA